MPVDVDARVRSNVRLSDEYNVLHLDAPAIAEAAGPGQFVMIKPARGLDPLLRRPFSIFEILRDDRGRGTGVSLLNKRVGAGTQLLYDAAAGGRFACLGPLGRPFTAVDPPTAAWLVAGGVGLAPFATLAAALRRRGTAATLFYGARRAGDLFFLELFEALDVQLVLATEDGSRGDRGYITGSLERALRDTPAAAPLMLYACGPTPMLREAARLARAAGRRLEVSLEQVMGCGLGGCYSCVVRVRRTEGPPHHVRSCLEGPVFEASAIVWEELTH